MTKNRHRSLVAGAIAVGAVAIGAVSLQSASAAPAPTTVTATAATAAEAASAAFANCQAQGYNADRVDGTVTNADGTVTVTMYCYTV